MTSSTLIWGAPQWWLPAGLLAAAALALAIWSYRRAHGSGGTWLACVILKSLGILLLAACLTEPLLSGLRPRTGANLFALLADNSQSLTIRDFNSVISRGEMQQDLLASDSAWQTRLSQDFDVRRYLFDARLRAVDDFALLPCDGAASSLVNSLEGLARRYQGRPLAGILLFTDGNATDLGAASADAAPHGTATPATGVTDWSRLPPIYPVVLGDDTPQRDVSLAHVAVTQTNFEDAPVTVLAEVAAAGFQGEQVVAQLVDEAGKTVSQQRATVEDGQPLAFRFQVRPEQLGVSFYQVRVAPEGEAALADGSSEATLANNHEWIAVDRGGEPYRVLYVAGRPNWEFKFLRRAIEEDPQVQLVALIRIARREPKFDFRGRAGESTNPLFRGFGKPGDEAAETYDKPVLVRLGTEDAAELRDGFPKTPEDLYRYHAIIVDDLEAEQFTPDQMALVQKFVGQRGGGFLMLGGQESFAGGKYDRTPLGDLLPVYLDRLPEPQVGVGHRLALEREGWLQPWVRLRSTEPDERKRLDAMPEFQTLNRVRGIKPGATLLAQGIDADGRKSPALVEQRFGKGRSLALTIGDLWRWALKPGDPPASEQPQGALPPAAQKSDLEKAWRQTIRSLVSDVPDRIEVEARHEQDDTSRPVRLVVRALDAKFEPLDNATVVVKVTSPAGDSLELTAAPSDARPGAYQASYAPRQPGPYRAEVTVAGPDGTEIGRRNTGWTSDPAAVEFRAVRPNRMLLERMARASGGRIVPAAELAAFVADLPNLKMPITEPSITPLWHQSWVFLLAILCLCGEWGLRRWKGLA